VPGEDLAVAHNERAGADDPIAVGIGVEESRERRPPGGRQAVLREGKRRLSGSCPRDKRGGDGGSGSTHVIPGRRLGDDAARVPDLPAYPRWRLQPSGLLSGDALLRHVGH